LEALGGVGGDDRSLRHGGPKAECVVNVAYLQCRSQAVRLSRCVSRQKAGADRTERGGRSTNVCSVIGRTGSAVRVTRGMVGGRKRFMSSWSRCEYSGHLWYLPLNPSVAVMVALLHIEHNP
jgi:hypothetical protein